MIIMKKNTEEIHELFGFDTYENYVDALGLENADGKRLQALTVLFLTLIGDKHSTGRENYLGYLTKVVVEATSGRPIQTPAEVVEYVNNTTSDEEIAKVLTDLMKAREFFGLKKDITLKDLMKMGDKKNGKGA